MSPIIDDIRRITKGLLYLFCYCQSLNVVERFFVAKFFLSCRFQNWSSEFRKWLGNERLKVYTVNSDKRVKVKNCGSAQGVGRKFPNYCSLKKYSRAFLVDNVGLNTGISGECSLVLGFHTKADGGREKSTSPPNWTLAVHLSSFEMILVVVAMVVVGESSYRSLNLTVLNVYCRSLSTVLFIQ